MLEIKDSVAVITGGAGGLSVEVDKGKIKITPSTGIFSNPL